MRDNNNTYIVPEKITKLRDTMEGAYGASMSCTNLMYWICPDSSTSAILIISSTTSSGCFSSPRSVQGREAARQFIKAKSMMADSNVHTCHQMAELSD